MSDGNGWEISSTESPGVHAHDASGLGKKNAHDFCLTCSKSRCYRVIDLLPGRSVSYMFMYDRKSLEGENLFTC